jgi:PPOX class probable F420-dependent enzyme
LQGAFVMPTEIDTARYVSFVSYKKDGSPVATPVWIVPFDGGYAFTTAPEAYKIRRIRNDARATLTICDMRGKTANDAKVYLGSAVVLDADASKKVEALVNKKYWIGTKLLTVMSVAKKILGKGSTAGDAAIKVTLHP